MSSIRLVSLAGVVLMALSSVACVAPTKEGEESGSKAGWLRNDDGSRPVADEQAGGGASGSGQGTCDGACAHYLECKGADTAENRAECTNNCEAMGLSTADLAAFERSDCATAIAAVEGEGSGGGKGSECDGCVSDGSSCVWLSQSDWGKGPYSGAAAECAAYCCE